MPTYFNYNSTQVGSIVPFGGGSVPAGFLLCDGSSLSRTTYARLFAVIGSAFGSANGSSFNIPDFRGRFLRGVDGGIARDPDRASRTAMNTGGNSGDNVGSIQADELKYHNHASGVNQDNVGGSSYAAITSQNNDNTGSQFPTGYYGGNETRPVNAYVNFLIKY